MLHLCCINIEIILFFLCVTSPVNYYLCTQFEHCEDIQIKMWWHPPAVERHSGKPHPGNYHHRRLFLWIPRMMWKVNFYCTYCGKKESLRSKGLYNKVCLVLDVKDYYYLAAGCMDCKVCSAAFIAWDHCMLDQLSEGNQAYFPVTSESIHSLQNLANGLMERFDKAKQPPPLLLYTDRDCCAMNGPSKYQRLIDKWPNLLVRLDI